MNILDRAQQWVEKVFKIRTVTSREYIELNTDVCRHRFKELLGLSLLPRINDVSGAFGRTFCVNEDYFIKIARTSIECEDLRKEAALSAFLQGKIPVQVSQMMLKNVVLLGVNGKERECLCAISKKIKGKTYRRYDDRTENLRVFVSAQIGEVMTALHKIDCQTLPLEVPVIDDLLMGHFEYDKRLISASSLRQALLTHLTQMPDITKKPVLCHGDWNWGNLVVNPNTYELVGLLDFGLSYKGPAISDLDNALLHHRDDFFDKYVQPEFGPMPQLCGRHSLHSAFRELSSKTYC